MTNDVARKELRRVHIEQEITNTDVFGWFHGWFHNQQQVLCALVELPDGKPHLYPLLEFHIVFEDEAPTPETIPST